LYLVFCVECQSEMPVSEPLPTNCRQNFRLRSPGHRVGTSGEEAIHRFRRIPLDVGEDVAVRIERNCDRGVAEPFGHHLRVHSRLQHESRCRVPQIVETHTCQPYCGFQLSEATADRGAIQGSARGPGEDKVVAGAAEDGGAGADYGGAACHEGRGRAHLPRHDSPDTSPWGRPSSLAASLKAAEHYADIVCVRRTGGRVDSATSFTHHWGYAKFGTEAGHCALSILQPGEPTRSALLHVLRPGIRASLLLLRRRGPAAGPFLHIVRRAA